MNKKAAIIAGVAIVGLLGAFTLGGKDKAQETEGISGIRCDEHFFLQ